MKILSKYSLCIQWALVVLPLYCAAQVPHLSFRHIDKNQGLSSNKVNAIQKGPSGHLWFGTADGLDRFDGRHIKAYPSLSNDSSTVSSGEILSMAISPDSTLFIGTREGGLNEYLPKKDGFCRFTIPNHKSVNHGAIWGMAFDGDSLVWLALEHGIAKFDRRSEGFELWRPTVANPNLSSAHNDIIYSIANDPLDPDLLWLGSRGGVLHFSKKEENFFVPFEEALSKVFLAVKDIHFEGDSTVWLGGNLGSVIQLSKNDFSFVAHYPDSISSFSTYFLVEGDEEHFWLGYPDRGLGVFEKIPGSFHFLQNDQLRYQHRPDQGSRCAFKDEDGLLWVGTERGVFFTNVEQQMCKHFGRAAFGKDGPQWLTAVGGVDLPDGKLLVAPYSGGKFFLFHKNRYHALRSIRASHNGDQKLFRELFKDQKNNIWVSTSAGLYQFDLENENLVRPKSFWGTPLEDQPIGELASDSNGNLYALGAEAVWLAKISSDLQSVRIFSHKTSAHMGFPEVEDLNSFAIGNHGEVWFFSEPLLFRYDPRHELFETFCCPTCEQEPLSSQWILSGEVDKEGRVWIGYNSGGLDCFDPRTGEVKNYRMSDGLIGEKVIQIKKGNNGILWLATNNGLSRLETKTAQFYNFSEKDGLLKYYPGYIWFSALQILNERELFIGTRESFTLFAPSLPDSVQEHPPLVLNEILVFDQKRKTSGNLGFSEKVELQSDENFFTIQFSALEFSSPERVRYRYRLNGIGPITGTYDQQWRETSEGRAVYTKVPSGSYEFRVNARLEGGAWMPEDRVLFIHISPPFYRTWWFLLACFTVAAVLFWQAYRWRIGQVREQARIRQRLAETELKALRAQMNPHFLFNSLNSIKNYIVKNEPRTAARYLTKFSRLMRLILSNSKDPAITLADELRALELYVELESLRFRQQFEYHFEVDKNLHLESIEIPPLVLQPYVENAIWHGLMHKKSGGKLWVRVFQKGTWLQVEVEDNGIGRERAKEIRSKSAIKRKSMGLRITSDRLSLLKNESGEQPTILIKDLVDAYGEAAGTLVHIKIPLENENG